RLGGGSVPLALPPTAVPQMHRYGIDPTRIDVILISHLHADHAFGLPFLLLEYCVRYERKEPLTLVGPPGIRELSESSCCVAWPDMREAGFHPRVPLVYREARAGASLEAAGIPIEAVPMNHFGLAAFGYRFTVDGKRFAYTGDTGNFDGLRDFLADVDVAIVELTHPAPKNDPGHLDVDAVRRLAASLQARGTRVFATHLSARPKPVEGVTLLDDGGLYYV
ncbi:MAG: MBL fold metallo-hydrolase, partial [Candidatus Bipolaricaulota bacterium]